MNNTDWKALVELLGSDNVDKIKNVITEQIIESLTESITSEWILMPEDIDNMVTCMIRDIMDEIKAKYRDALFKQIDGGFKRFINDINGGFRLGESEQTEI